MKKGLVVFLILILIIVAFFAGTKANIQSDNEASSTKESSIIVSATEKITTTDVVITSEKITASESETYEQYEPQGFAKIGKNFDTLIMINDYFIHEDNNRSFIIVENSGSQGYYFEYPYAIEIKVQTQWDYYFEEWDESKETIKTSILTDEMHVFDFYDDYTLAIGENQKIEKIVIEDIIDINEIGAIIKTKIDKIGIDNDEENVYFFVTEFEKLIELPSEECGDVKYVKDKFNGYKERKIYF